MRFTWRNVSDVLSDKELKNTLGGYGEGGYGWQECCECDYELLFEDGNNVFGSGGFCGKEGDPDCFNGVREWVTEQKKYWKGEGLTDIHIRCDGPI
jgi:hypothetical protein